MGRYLECLECNFDSTPPVPLADDKGIHSKPQRIISRYLVESTFDTAAPVALCRPQVSCWVL